VAKESKRARIRRALFYRPPAGSSPGTVLPRPSASPTLVQALAYDPEHVYESHCKQLSDIHHIRSKAGLVWLQVTGLGDAGFIQELCHTFGIHRLTIEDILNQTERPKAEFYEHYAFISVHTPHKQGQRDSDMVSLLFGKGFVLTIQEHPIEALEAIRNRIQKKIGQIRFQNEEYLTYAILDTIIDLYFPIAEDFAEQLDSAEESIIHGQKPSAVLEIYNMRSRINAHHRLLWSHKELINELIRDPESPMNDDTCVYLRDCFDHCIQIIDFLESLRDTSKTLIDLHLSLQAHHSNEIIKVLTIVTSTFIPMSFISGVYGMNFDRTSRWNMPELGWEYGYPFSLFLMFCTAASLWFYFYRKKWFSFAYATRRELERTKEP
jgi:magnesium transporter